MKKIDVNFVADSGAATASLEPNESRLVGNIRPRNQGLISRLQARGPEALTDAELVAVLLSVPVEKAADMVRDVSAPAATGGRNAARMTALAEYAKRTRNTDPRPVIDSARAVAGIIPAAVREANKEHFLILCLNARRQLTHLSTVSIGTLSASLVHPRECFFPAIEHAAAAVVAVHNHPSGDPTPSSEDRDVTRRLQRAGELLGIPLADHVVVSASGFFSFREHGLI
jgi:DNA repair protein RadC